MSSYIASLFCPVKRPEIAIKIGLVGQVHHMYKKNFFKSRSAVFTFYLLLGGLFLSAIVAVFSVKGFSATHQRFEFKEAGVYTVNDIRGGKIILSVPQDQIIDTAVQQKSWTKVQWQNDSGSWIDVHGWQGSFHPKSTDTSLFVEWWVGPEILGDGPFRWVIYADESGTQYLSTTDSFSLPASNLQSIVVVPKSLSLSNHLLQPLLKML